MSTAARARSPAKRGFALLALLLLASCGKTDRHAEAEAFTRAFTEAVLRRDFDAVYPLVRGTMNREALEGRLSGVWSSTHGDIPQLVGADDWAVFRTGWLLAGGYEYLVNPHKYPEGYNEKLREPSLLQDRFRAAVLWLRRAADRGVLETGEMLAEMYRDVRFGLPKDDELAKCFADAARSRIIMTICRRLEQAKGYDPSP